MQNLILFQTVRNSDREFGFQAQKKLKNKENFIDADEFIFQKIKIFLIKKFVLWVEEDKADMQNLILFHSVRNSGGVFMSQPQKKLKNKENLIHADEFSFEKMKIFLIKSSSSEYKKTRSGCRISFSLKLSQIQMEKLGLNRRRSSKKGKFHWCSRIHLSKKLKFFLSIVRSQSSTRQGDDAELNSLSNCHEYRPRILVSTPQETEK